MKTYKDKVFYDNQMYSGNTLALRTYRQNNNDKNKVNSYVTIIGNDSYGIKIHPGTLYKGKTGIYHGYSLFNKDRNFSLYLSRSVPAKISRLDEGHRNINTGWERIL